MPKYIVGPHKNGQYQIIKVGSTRASIIMTSINKAISKAIDLAQNAGGGYITVQDDDGKFVRGINVEPR